MKDEAMEQKNNTSLGKKTEKRSVDKSNGTMEQQRN